MRYHIVDIALRPETSARISVQQLYSIHKLSLTYLGDEVLQVITHKDLMALRVWENDVTVSDEQTELVMIFVHKGRPSSCHLID